MAICALCGNDYELAFDVTLSNGDTHTFDSFECAIQTIAPRCHHCGCPIIGHGLSEDGLFYCCDHCLRQDEVVAAADHG
jgi:hypothetical protein